MAPVASERGVALVVALLVMMLMSALIAGFLATVNADQASSGIERDQTQAYAAAHAGVEKLTADMGQLFAANFSPTAAQVNALAADGQEPDLPNIAYERPDGTSGYRVTFNPGAGGNPAVENPAGSQITAGPYQGLIGLITPYNLEVTARTAGNAEVKMRRTFQTVAIPVFQFGLFSENNLSFHAGDNFSFGGRVHSNANIFIAAAGGATLTLQDRVTAVGEVVRRFFSNGRSTETAGYTGPIRMAKAPGCPAAPTAATAACRNLAMTEGSVTGNVGSAANANWANISVGSYNSYIRTTLTGARRLDLPLVSDGAEPIDLIRRPPAGVVEPVQLAEQRFYNLATLRILLSDSAADLTALPDAVGVPVSLDAAALPGAAGGYPLATSTGVVNDGYRSAAGTPLIGGFILINRQDTAGNWTDVTDEILSLGISGRNLGNGSLASPAAGTCTTQHSNAIIRLQRIKDNAAASPNHCNMPAVSTGFWPNTLYDAREALLRDNASTSGNNGYLGGVMHYVEFDVDNFRRWITGATGASGPGSQNTTGYVVYFSDRRNNKNAANAETGEYGWEDFVNPTSAAGSPNNALNTGEDVNANTTLQTYGNTPQIGYTVVNASGGSPWGSSGITTTSTVHGTLVNKAVARSNRAVFFRRALKLVNGGLGALPSNGLQGLTIASENPVYVQGNFNACGASGGMGTAGASCASGGFGPTNDAHRSAAIIADSVTLLSRAWNDLNSFNTPHSQSTRVASTTWYRAAIISGKGLTFPHPNNGEFANFGSDGGAHNFLRFLEDWGSATVNYKGSMVSLFFSRQAVGTWKCCTNVYSPPNRAAFFDDEFLTPNLLPPRTPMFRDVNTLTFRQILRPTQ
jgi:hypothetical protein